MRYHYVLYLLLSTLSLACAPHHSRAPVGERSRLLHNPPVHEVRQGETLYSVAFLYGYEVSQVAAWNALKAPYTIYKGQRLRLRPPPPTAPAPKAPVPAPAAKPQPRSAALKIRPSLPKRQPVAASQPKTDVPGVRSRSPRPAAAGPARRGPGASTVAAKPPRAMLPSSRLRWDWPAKGVLLSAFHADSEGRKGIDIGGKRGQPVRAAAAGKVVYSGSGLSGYGRLIIIKHNKEFLSAYAHNRKLIASEGQWVDKGQEIALMGNSGTDRVQLHFEIRKHGKPVNPLQYLPRR